MKFDLKDEIKADDLFFELKTDLLIKNPYYFLKKRAENVAQRHTSLDRRKDTRPVNYLL